MPLLAPLIGGQRYLVSFHVSRADNYRYAVAELGAYFSKLPLTANGFFQNFAVMPQVENSPTNLLASTNGWMLVQGTFVANGSGKLSDDRQLPHRPEYDLHQHQSRRDQRRITRIIISTTCPSRCSAIPSPTKSWNAATRGSLISISRWPSTTAAE